MWNQKDHLFPSREVLANDLRHNLAEIFRLVGPAILELDSTLNRSASRHGYPPLHSHHHSSQGLQPNTYSHRSFVTLEATPDPRTAGSSSFPNEYRFPTLNGSAADFCKKYLPKLPKVTLTHHAQLVGHRNSMMDGFTHPDSHKKSVLREHKTTFALAPVFPIIDIKSRSAGDDSLTELKFLQYDYRVVLDTPSFDAICAEHEKSGSRRNLPMWMRYRTEPDRNVSFYSANNWARYYANRDLIAEQHPEKGVVQPDKQNASVQEILAVLAPSIAQLCINAILGEKDPKPKERSAPAATDLYGMLHRPFKKTLSMAELQHYMTMFAKPADTDTIESATYWLVHRN